MVAAPCGRRGAVGTLAVGGGMAIGAPVAIPPQGTRNGVAAVLRPPGIGHPEKLVPHLPPSPAERALWAQFDAEGGTLWRTT
ncbi:DUF6059 family protein [Streptomyces collinus]|uniref:DUF6059 family protein n=1 Tax=Streptomyces collinus TaxID=42684 RepID=UPI0036C9E5AB